MLPLGEFSDSFLTPLDVTSHTIDSCSFSVQLSTTVRPREWAGEHLLVEDRATSSFVHCFRCSLDEGCR